MGPAFPSRSWWLWSGKQQEPRISNESLPDFLSEAGLLESAWNYPLFNGAYMASPSRRVKSKCHTRGKGKVDKDYDVVLVPSDGGCLSGSDSDDSDWSVGWLEPHGPEFLSGDDVNNSFAVLVPCYGKVRTEISNNGKVFGNVGSILDSHSDGAENQNMK